MTTGDGDVRGDAGALGPDRLLRDLDHDLLPLAQERVDRGRGAVVAPAAPAAGLVLVAVESAVRTCTQCR